MLAALSLCSCIKFSTASPALDIVGLPKGPSRLRAGLMSKLRSCLLGSESVVTSEFLVPIEEFVLAPSMWVVLAFCSTVDRKADNWLLNLPSSILCIQNEGSPQW